MEKEGYKKKFGCDNCNSDTNIEIPWGVEAQDYLGTNKKCPKCGCERLFLYS